jgi:hypothetical protein
MGMLTLLAAECAGALFLGAGFGWAMTVKDPAVTNISDKVRRVILCINVLLKGASMLAIEPEQRHSRRVAWHNLAGKNETIGLVPQLSWGLALIIPAGKARATINIVFFCKAWTI